MRKLNKLLLCLAFLSSGSVASAQVEVSFGQASDNKFTQGEPAKLIATFPSDKDQKSSFLINSYLALGGKFWTFWRIAATAELQRNSLIDKKQHVQQYGLKVERPWDLEGMQETLLISTLSAKYSNDFINKKKGAQFNLAFSVTFPRERTGSWIWQHLRPFAILPADDGGTFSDLLQYKHTHSVGIDYIGYEQMGLFNASGGLELYPFSGLLKNIFKRYSLLQLKGTYIARHDFTRSSTNLYKGPSWSLGAAVNYKFDKDGNRALSVGYEYVNGGNPLKGLADQQYGQITLGAKVSL